MKITSFNSFIATSQTDETIRLFEELGFERRHKKEGIEIAERDDTVIRMKDGNGFYLDVLQTDSGPTRDTMGIRMNVDDFDEAYQLLVKNGFRNYYGDNTASTRTGKSAIMISSTGFVINLVQHIK